MTVICVIRLNVMSQLIIVSLSYASTFWREVMREHLTSRIDKLVRANNFNLLKAGLKST